MTTDLPGNSNLDFAGKSVVIRSVDGAAATTIDCNGTGTAIANSTIGGAFAVLEGFTIVDGLADRGGGVMADQSRLMLKDCVLTGNEASAEGGGLCSNLGVPTLDNVRLESNTATVGTNGYISSSNVYLQGSFAVADDTLEVRSSGFSGPGHLALEANALMNIAGDAPGALPTVFRSDIRGLGDIHIPLGAALQVEHGAVIDLSGELGGGCADASEAANWGTIFIDGSLIVRDATIQNTNVEVSLADFEGDVGIINNNITLLEASAGFGGQFFVQDAARIRCNTITSYGDRYLDLDPDPSIPVEERPRLEDNHIHVIITQGVGSERGELLELRAEDFDCTSNGVNPTCASGAFPAPGSPGFTTDPSENWVLDSLEIEPGAKLNLTNRDGFVYQDPQIATPETVYVKDLVLHENATLNLALQTLYYETLTMEPGSAIVNIPLLGFSLKQIDMEDDTEFDVRIRKRVRDLQDDQPQSCASNASTCLEGAIALAPNPINSGGLLAMRTQADDRQSASSVAAKGIFARAGEENVTVVFDYLFVQNPDAELIVYLSADPDVSEGLVRLATIRPPTSGPGAIDSNTFATFYGVFPAGTLNFTRGTYVELELRGTNAAVWIDRWDPQVRCAATCGDFAPPDGVATEDFLVLLAEYGRGLDPFVDSSKMCLDSALSGDQYVDLSDLFAQDLFLNGSGLDSCGSGYGGALRRGSGTGAPVSLPATSQLVIAGKPNTAGVQRDYLYTVSPDGECAGPPLDPASAPDPIEGYRSNSRLIQDGAGNLYQIHATQGVIRLDNATAVIPPSSFNVAGDTVYVGVVPQGTSSFAGVPLTDVAFDPADNTIAYAVPVLVVPAGTDPEQGICPYKAAAKLQLIEQPDGSYTVSLLRLYGTSPADDACVTVTPNFSCQLVVPNPDLQRLREIEIDPAGENLFVLSAQALGNNNDWLLVFDEATGAELRVSRDGTYPAPTPMNCPAATGPGIPLPAAPTAMTISADGGALYLASSLGSADSQDVRTEVSAFTVQRAGSVVTGLTLDRLIDIDCNAATTNGLGLGHLATVTSINERPADGALFVTGFTAPRVDPDLSVNDPLYQAMFGRGAPIFTTPTLAFVPSGATTATANRLRCAHLALPVSATFHAGTLPGDCDGDGDVDLADFANTGCFIDCLEGPNTPVDAPCTIFDLDHDGDVDLSDFAELESVSTAAPRAVRRAP